MTAKSRANLKAAFETGDKPRGDDFGDLIDSFVSITDTSAQSPASQLIVPSVATGTVSATTVNANVLYVRGLATHENPYCEAYADVTAITSVEATATWTLVSALLTAPNKSAFTVSGHDVTYTGGVTAKFMIEAQIDARGSTAEQWWFGVAKNAALVSGSITKGKITNADLVTRTTRAIVELKGNDILATQVQVPDGPIGSLQVFGVRYMIAPVFWG
jgi:hypothetical protein